MEQLLFQNELISWISPWTSSLWVSLGVFLSILTLIVWKQYRKTPIPLRALSPYKKIPETDEEYVSKTLASLKEYLRERKMPHHVIAHTADEIATYVDNSTLSDIIHELEHIEYSGQSTGITEHRGYNERIEKVLV